MKAGKGYGGERAALLREQTRGRLASESADLIREARDARYRSPASAI